MKYSEIKKLQMRIPVNFTAYKEATAASYPGVNTNYKRREEERTEDQDRYWQREAFTDGPRQARRPVSESFSDFGGFGPFERERPKYMPKSDWNEQPPDHFDFGPRLFNYDQDYKLDWHQAPRRQDNFR